MNDDVRYWVAIMADSSYHITHPEADERLGPFRGPPDDLDLGCCRGARFCCGFSRFLGIVTTRRTVGDDVVTVRRSKKPQTMDLLTRTRYSFVNISIVLLQKPKTQEDQDLTF